MGRGYFFQSNNHKAIVRFLKKNIFALLAHHVRLLVMGEITFTIVFKQLMKKYGITHKVVTLYHPHMSGH